MTQKSREKTPEIKPVHMVHRFVTTNPLSWILFPQLIKRVETFCNAHDTDLTVDQMLPMIKAVFVSDNTDALLYGVVDGMDLIGHMIARKEVVGSKSYILIYHGEIDEVDQKAVQKIMDDVVEFAKIHKCPEIKLVTARNPEGFERRYGFTRQQTIMRKPVDLKQEGGVKTPPKE